MEYVVVGKHWPRWTICPIPQLETFIPVLLRTKMTTSDLVGTTNWNWSWLTSVNYSGALMENFWRRSENWLPLSTIRSNLEKWVIIWHSYNHGSHLVLLSNQNFKTWPSNVKLKQFHRQGQDDSLKKNSRYWRCGLFELGAENSMCQVYRGVRKRSIRRNKGMWKGMWKNMCKPTHARAAINVQYARVLKLVSKNCWWQRSYRVVWKLAEKMVMVMMMRSSGKGFGDSGRKW